MNTVESEQSSSLFASASSQLHFTLTNVNHSWKHYPLRFTTSIDSKEG